MDVCRSQVRVLGEDLVGRHPVRDHRHDRGDRKAQPPDARQPAHDSGVGGDAFVGHVFMLAASGVAAQSALYAVVAARLISAKAGELPSHASRIGPRATQRPEAAGVVEVGWRCRAERRSASSGASPHTYHSSGSRCPAMEPGRHDQEPRRSSMMWSTRSDVAVTAW